MRKTLYLWLISQDVERGYDTYDSAVVAAYTEAEARATHPSGDNSRFGEHFPTWAPQDFVQVTRIGRADPTISPGVVCAADGSGASRGPRELAAGSSPPRERRECRHRPDGDASACDHCSLFG